MKEGCDGDCKNCNRSYSDPRDRYHKDAQYKCLVDCMLSLITKCEFTPSEMRQAAVLASTLYEERNIRPALYYLSSKDLPSVLGELRKFTEPRV